MSLDAMRSVWGADFPDRGDGVDPATVRLVALAMADVVNDMHHNEFYGSVTNLAVKTGVDRKTAGRAVAHLVEVGVLEVLEGSKDAEGNPTGRPAKYRWRGVGRDASPGEAQSDTGWGVPPRDTQEKPKKRPKSSSSSADDGGSSWPIFWASYPRKVSKQGAFKLWLKMNATDRWQAVEGIRARAAWWEASRTPMDKIPHPTTWLGGRRWEDEVEAVAAPPENRNAPVGDRLSEAREFVERARNMQSGTKELGA